MDDDGWATLFVIVAVVIACVITALVSYEKGYNRMAQRIAEGTHKVEHTTNAFGTMEWRVVEVKKEGMEE